jgi:hypothetical protein
MIAVRFGKDVGGGQGSIWSRIDRSVVKDTKLVV